MEKRSIKPKRAIKFEDAVIIKGDSTAIAYLTGNKFDPGYVEKVLKGTRHNDVIENEARWYLKNREKRRKKISKSI
jgi:hypothetical protein